MGMLPCRPACKWQRLNTTEQKGNSSMSDNNRVIVRNAREQDIPAVADIAAEANSSYGTVEKAETFQFRLTAFPNGFIILVAENEIAAYGCSEKWLAEHEPGLNENPLATHQPDGRIFYIKDIAVKRNFQGRGYRLLLLDKLLETAHLEGCKKVVVETAQSRDLYLQRGFQTVQTRTMQGIPLEVMSLELKSISRNS
jgi:N-acetylglutamate synthase-like GNAT family acetyltransferase